MNQIKTKNCPIFLPLQSSSHPNPKPNPPQQYQKTIMYPLTTINDIPDVILSTILSLITSPRTRNSSSLVSRKWCALERYTRSSLTLRGNIRDLFMMPNCFPNISHLDLSFLSPWGHTIATSSSDNDDDYLIAHLLHQYFPTVLSLTFYARNKDTIQLLLSQWERVECVKLVRWHQRPQAVVPGEELKSVFSNCVNMVSLDLSSFYCWTEDLCPALEAFPVIASKLSCLNLLNKSFPEGFKSEEIKGITKCCPGLREFKAACMFDPRYIGFVGDEGLVCVARNCPNLRVLHLADTKALGDVRGDLEDEGFTDEDARISVGSLIEVFSGLTDLEDLVLDVCNNVRDSGPALEILHSKCKRLRSVRLGRFHGISMPVESKLDGVAVCQRLEALSIGNVGDLTDMGLIGIGRGCSRLRKFEIYGCKMVTVRGMRTLASLLHKTLIDVKISCCKNLGAASSLKALEPLQSRIERLHIDCVWESPEVVEGLDGITSRFDLNSSDQGEVSCNNGSNEYDEMSNASKRCKYSYDLNSCAMGFDLNGDGYDNGNGFAYAEKTWERLKHLSLWIAVGELLTPLQSSGLENCPNLEEIQIKVEGDCRTLSKPSKREFGLSGLVAYPRLSKMQLDCGEVIGFAHTAPSGQMDLSLWERFYLFGIGHLNLMELDYWPPQDRDVNQRSLSLPAAGLLQECIAIRKLFIHGTAHEHFMMFFLRIPGLRDVQLREDYYPAPENDMSTEMRADSCSRFETALNRRLISD